MLLNPYPIAHDKFPSFLSAADVFISTSLMEDSSNVIKEAMASGCPLVATNVGDASWVTDNNQGMLSQQF